MDEFVVGLAELAASPRQRHEIGGKAYYLSRLLAAGLPVPDGIVLTASVAALSKSDRERVLADARVRLIDLSTGDNNDVWVVRSSAALEDDIAASAPGVFASLLQVATSNWKSAVQRVWASARTELVRDYARVRGVDDLSVAVITQRQVPEVPSRDTLVGTLYTRTPGQPDDDHMLLEIRMRDDESRAAVCPPIRITNVRCSTDKNSLLDTLRRTVGKIRSPISMELLAQLVNLGLSAERAIVAKRGVDVEWVAHEQALWIVQARPIVHPERRQIPMFPGVLLAFSRLEPDRVWRFDVTHNPDPLSPAQAGLIERMDDARLAPYRMRVVGGYLYTSSEPRLRTSAPKNTLGVDSAMHVDGLRHRYENELRPAMEACLAPSERLGETAGLLKVLDTYERFYAIYAAELSPLVSRAKRALSTFLHEHLDPETVAALAGDVEHLTERLLAGTRPVDTDPAGLDDAIANAARGECSLEELTVEVGAMASAWDVSCTTFAEERAVLERAMHAWRDSCVESSRANQRSIVERQRDSIDRALAVEERDRLDEVIALTRYARRLSEADDILFARAQALVRWRLLDVARAWQLEPEADIFYIPLETVLTCLEHGHPPELSRVRRLARAGRNALDRQRGFQPPMAFQNGQPIAVHARTSHKDGFVGRGFGSRVRGVAIRVEHASQRPTVTEDTIVVAATLTPAMAVWVRGARAIVAEHGGLLDHGAAMARELGIPCVVGCVGAWSAIRTGDALWLDGDAGFVVKVRSTT